MVSLVAITSGAPASAAAFQPTLPAGYATSDRMVLVVTGKYNTTTVPTINQGWTLVANGTGGTGSAAADTGQMFYAVYAKDATSGAETAPTVTPGATAPNSWTWHCSIWRYAAGRLWRDAIAAAAAWVQSVSDATTASPLTGTTPAWPTNAIPNAGDALLGLGALPTDLGTALGTTTFTNAGLTGGTKVTATSQYVENGFGDDVAAVWAYWTGWTLNSTTIGGSALSFTVTGATNQSGVLIALALREKIAAPATFENTAEGYTVDGTTVTPGNSGGGSGTALALSGTITAENDAGQAFEGGWYYQTPALSATPGNLRLLHATARDQQISIRCYSYITGAPSAAMEWLRAVPSSGGGGTGVNMTTNRFPQWGASPFTIGTAALPLNTWFREELIVDHLQAASGKMRYRAYDLAGTLISEIAETTFVFPTIDFNGGSYGPTSNATVPAHRHDAMKIILGQYAEVGPVIPPVPECAYGFNEGSGSTAADSSGNARNITATTPATAWDAGGKTGGGAKGKFTGAFGPNTSLSSYTIMGWVKRTGTWSQFAGLFTTTNGLLECSAAASYVPNYYNGANSAAAATALALDTLTHVAVVCTAGSCQMFINGVASGSPATGGTAKNFSTAWKVLGVAGDDGENSAFVGVLDEFRIFPAALSAFEVTTWMNTPITPPAGSGQPKVWTGAAWAKKPLKVWTGAAWVAKPVKVWTGAAWKTLT